MEPLVREADQLRAIRAVECLQLIGSEQAMRLLAWLASGIPEARLTQETQASFQQMSRKSTS
jgi:hypothetical protein